MKAIGYVPRLPGADHAVLAGQPIGLNSMVSFRQAYLQKAHDKLAVELRNGQTVKGRLSGVSDTSLTLADGRKVTDVSRVDVLKIRVKRAVDIKIDVATLISEFRAGALHFFAIRFLTERTRFFSVLIKGRISISIAFPSFLSSHSRLGLI